MLDALMESGGRIRTHRTRFSGIAAVCNCSVVCLLVLWPLLHPASLPKQALNVLLVAPTPPAPPLNSMLRATSLTRHPLTLVNPFAVPRVILGDAPADHEPLSDITAAVTPFVSNARSFVGLPDSIDTGVPLRVLAAPTKKLAVSSGVMDGRKLNGVVPRYPTIAIAAQIQGTVMLAATITRTGTIENLRVVSGSPMLAPGAAEAVRTWRYRPYLLNGEPVEVETTVQVIFNLSR